MAAYGVLWGAIVGGTEPRQRCYAGRVSLSHWTQFNS
jgi:hypothetical protein